MTHSHAINWAEIFLTGFFTFAGAGIGAWFAGRYAILSVVKQLEYQESNKHIKILDDHLKINKEFESEINIFIDHLELLIEVLFDNKLDFSNIKTDPTITITRLKEIENAIDKPLSKLSKINIDNMPYGYNQNYTSVLYSLEGMKHVCSSVINMAELEKLRGEESIQFMFEYVNHENDYDFLEKDLLQEKKYLEDTLTTIKETGEVLLKEYESLNKNIKKLIQI